MRNVIYNSVTAFALVCVIFSSQVAIAQEESTGNALRDSGNALSFGSEIANKSGAKNIGRALGPLAIGLTGASAVQNASKGDMAAAVGDITSGVVGLVTVPVGTAIGTAIGGPGLGTVVGAGGGVAVAGMAGKLAESAVRSGAVRRAVRRIQNSFADNRTDFQKRMDDVGLNPADYANEIGLRSSPRPGELARFQAQLRRQLTQLEADAASRAGRSYRPDAYTLDEIRYYESLASQQELKAKLRRDYARLQAKLDAERDQYLNQLDELDEKHHRAHDRLLAKLNAERRQYSNQREELEAKRRQNNQESQRIQGSLHEDWNRWHYSYIRAHLDDVNIFKEVLERFRKAYERIWKADKKAYERYREKSEKIIKRLDEADERYRKAGRETKERFRKAYEKADERFRKAEERFRKSEKVIRKRITKTEKEIRKSEERLRKPEKVIRKRITKTEKGIRKSEKRLRKPEKVITKRIKKAEKGIREAGLRVLARENNFAFGTAALVGTRGDPSSYTFEGDAGRAAGSALIGGSGGSLTLRFPSTVQNSVSFL